MTGPPGAGARELHEGQAAYTAFTLRGYDLAVHGINIPLFWKCPPRHMADLYERNITTEHLDIGVGTGRLIARCSPTARRKVTLVDLNRASLAHTARRLADCDVTVCRADILQPLPLPPESHGSAGLNFLLHCLPGGMDTKARALDHAARCVRPGGRVFGSTVLASGLPVSAGGRLLMRALNRRGVFHNTGDSLTGLREALAARFPEHRLWTHGCVAFFEGTVFEGTVG
ncbi:class I SAM-dependent methyltransferase [Streptomyces gamaensis]|uniref:Class I SAM-dependent methyltransferase n=1 Tax=Streptomyces gamaensis TaxID=1763542 RepID=A0ABW0Z1J0_9ACTN